jgi:hypothetical protein
VILSQTTREMIRREIARRDEDGRQWPAFAFIVSDDAPVVDIDATIETIVSLAGNPAAKRVYINRCAYKETSADHLQTTVLR